MTSQRAWSWCTGLALGVGLVLLWKLPATWRNSPFDHWGGVAAGLWTINWAVLLYTRGVEGRPGWGATGLGLLILGIMADLSVFVHIGIASLSVGWLRLTTWRRLWLLVTGLSWMPVLGWLGSHWAGTEVVNGFRVALALSAGAVWVRRGE